MTTAEEIAYTFNVGDFSYSDVEGDALVSVTLSNLNLAGGTLEHSGGTTVTNGMTLSAAQIATLVYTPAGDANGAPLATFDFTVNDADAGVTTDVTSINDAPVVDATASDTGTEDTDQVYTHAQLLALIGATDVDDVAVNLTISITNVSNGTLVMSGGTGGAGTTFTFTPTANFNGNLTFDYQVSDDESPTPAGSAVGTATVALAPVNDAPVAVDDSYATNEDGRWISAAILGCVGQRYGC